MDDHKSRQQIDELADLYLTGVLGDEPDADDAPPEAPASAIEGPAPIRLSPKTGAPASPARDADTDEPDDRHPVLRLTEDAASVHNPPAEPDEDDHAATPQPEPEPDDWAQDAGEAEPAPQAVLEAVLLGNLPGMSGPWLTQYAQLIAQTEGPALVLHVGEEAIDVQVIEPRAEAQPAPTRATGALRIPPMRGRKTGLVGLIDALTRSESAPTRTILVRMDAGQDPVALSRLASFRDITLLCGADDASTAGASATLRRLTQADPRLADRQVGLMVMGSDEPDARRAAERVAQDTRADLISPAQFIGHLKRMQPVQVREIGSFPDPVGVWPQLVAWFDTLEAPQLEHEPEPEPVVESIVPEPASVTPAPTPAPQPPNTPATAPRLSPAAARLASPASRTAPRPTFAPTPSQPHPTPRTAPTPGPATPAPRTAAARPAATQPQQATAPRPDRASAPGNTATAEPTRNAPAPRVLAPRPELDLVALLAQGPAALADPAPLEARIPDQPDTQLAVDAHGVVHVLHKTVSDTISGGEAVMQLIEAGRWVSEHLELLALTQRDRAFIDHEPTLHLLTDRADQTTRLVGKLAGRVKLHLLQEVVIGKATGWFCTPLG